MSQLRLIRIVLSLALVLFGGFSAFAQSDLGTIRGSVSDPSGAVVPNASVTAINQGTGTERKVVTDDAGVYTVTNIPAGVYSVVIEAAGFKKFETRNNKLDSSSTLEINATLTVGAATETVEVSATAAQLQTESASVQKLITRQQIDALELNGRNPVVHGQPGSRRARRQPVRPVVQLQPGSVATSTARATRKT